MSENLLPKVFVELTQSDDAAMQREAVQTIIVDMEKSAEKKVTEVKVTDPDPAIKSYYAEFVWDTDDQGDGK